MEKANRELQRLVTRLLLTMLDGASFALAGSGAIREHGITDRPTEDIDLFTSNTDTRAFGQAVDRVLDGLRAASFIVAESRRSAQFARLHVETPSGERIDVDLGMDWREDDPVLLQIGPVLSVDDAVGNKVSALYSRAEARDFLDVDAIRSSGRSTDEQLLSAARERDPGFEPLMFAQQLDRAERLTPDRVREYGVSPDALSALQSRFAIWALRIRENTS
ncbi:nucleotidyltransferase AbiEii toxin of type IV toxin-antitoxin system [Rathayibacter sp. PhB152]|uniref:nucleotidyl transferase AbiEii/AbiGii toxin family protein n=1 Tax=unclassified Rathayibacter TaxID=2609250 RepID=UPI000FB10DDB|nr:nucleotidyl transferase AbiEii/AbiGii toxin family protein [Rathayibacter sp. PhB152]ROQ54876.1 nucleotidyltransferase AbiEii toxin of type IV toxin-antitoxin system [Rathayibacter sp. PhB152]ROS28992.1 nucleotidyltransferase AbiEii toxin of type IV toxin-antitoxin system [Rathayibacter sp. PhB127]TDX80588.1 nucleotidyltransferase AbiEii toxin of type IV toxin-antitoxin system [Rathayibacter sp. PhB151]